MSIFNQLLKKTTPQQGIVLYYLVAIVIAFLLLNLPFVHKPNVNVNPIDTLFVAVSGISVTGLSPVNIVDTYSTFGQVIILIILNIGGIGVMAIGTLLWVVLGKRIGIRERQLIMLDNNRETMSGTVKLILDIVKTIFVIELVGALLLAFYFYRDNPDLKNALMQGLFVSISATTNGGLDITGESLIPYANDYFVQTIVMVLIILGSIGFPVLLETKAYIKNRITNFRFSLFTKITTSTYFFLFFFGIIAILALEHNHAFKGLSWHQELFYSFFQSATTRSAGLQTIDVTNFSDATNIIMSLLMFIGSSPSSVGGGIRTTTFAILILFALNFSNNEEKTSIKVFNRELHIMDIQRSFAVFIMASILTFVSMIVIATAENGKLTFLQVFFEVMSAFGTCGLTLGVTDDISNVTKIVLMVLMFIGRVGLISFIIMIAGRREPDKYHYPKERIQIG
ncbi:TrkH family potassium uptake protein [Staphylococcus lugdunensis]|jgi:potassium uptake TrkH family protein|uniref:Cation transport protein n=1 Tax=Staphylococcus lugdunensis TaxID=28035 RepID=A0A133Q8Y9_STALU|nr:MULTISPECIES: TrkH family potassium uptake protein [Staphylococcus]ADC87933.1 Potassium uptake protein, integral membrane component, KtrD [Staphylococcus lugdunensis HKU09-01]AMG61052.1 ATP synthase [Staphylococcus lugdunensis]ARB78158.1 Ktr system potassium uptake protein D [Staphylococcus lugdunensis]ARJ09682.1 Ktr system potassium uptake protein D [Staphylococcus lugdunensis]ARJ11863.1 Ktr system potassium uptake protein D [Staphylococcus lugdunensis]